MSLSRTPRILMCSPDYFGIEYEINPWMKLTRRSNKTRAVAQWTALRNTLTELGAEVEILAPVPGLPDLVFTANAALMWHDRAYVARFRYGPRQGETAVDAGWFRAAGYEARFVPEEWNFEGAGDALFCGDTLYGGYSVRSDREAIDWLGTELDVPTVALRLVNPRFYHLDTCFCPLSETEALYFPGAFDAEGLRRLEATVPHLIPVAAAEAARFACNAVVVGRDVVLNSGCPRVVAQLAERGYRAHPLPLSEFLKSGGSSKCLTLRLDGEEAASWAKSSVVEREFARLA